MKLPSSQYRGVVAQQSGKWGAQIYKNDQRIWLGTFCTEVEAAQAYDIAARCLHGTNAVNNFNSLSKSDEVAEAELHFLKSHSMTEIVSMLRRHTYHEELKRSQYMHQIHHLRCNNAGTMMPNATKTRELLFHKVVSTGDVGAQNRLLLPRQHVKKHFSLFRNISAAGRRGVMINVEDEAEKIWRFRCVYWRSSHHYVLNGGWAQFARDKGLRPGDTVRFWQVTTELGDVRLFVECDTKKTATTPPWALELPMLHPDKVIRLFGVNVSVTSN